MKCTNCKTRDATYRIWMLCDPCYQRLRKFALAWHKKQTRNLPQFEAMIALAKKVKNS